MSITKPSLATSPFMGPQPQHTPRCQAPPPPTQRSHPRPRRPAMPVQQPGTLEQGSMFPWLQLYTNPSSLEGLPGPSPQHLLSRSPRPPDPQQYSRLSRSRSRVRLAPAEDGVAACLPHRSSSSASPARLKWHLTLCTLPEGSGQGAWPSRHGDQDQWPVPPLSLDSTPPVQPCCLAVPAPPAATASAARLALAGGWSRSDVQKGEGGGRRDRETQTEREREG